MKLSSQESRREANKKAALKTYFVNKLNDTYGPNKYGES